MNRYEEAASVFMEGLKIDPENAQLKNGLEDAQSKLSGNFAFALDTIIFGINVVVSVVG